MNQSGEGAVFFFKENFSLKGPSVEVCTHSVPQLV